MAKSISNRKHPSTKNITPADVDAYIESLGGLDENGELPADIRAELYKILDEKGFKRPIPIKENQ